jgi:hypothetical protein
MTLNLSRSNVVKLNETVHNIDVGRLYDAWTEIEALRAKVAGMIIEPSANVTNTFQVNQANGTNVFTVDTATPQVSILGTALFNWIYVSTTAPAVPFRGQVWYKYDESDNIALRIYSGSVWKIIPLMELG